MSRDFSSKPRWLEITEAVQEMIAEGSDRSSAIAAVSSFLKVRQDVVSRALKCDAYVVQHGRRETTRASQTNIELLMSLEQIDLETGRSHREAVLDGSLSYMDLKRIADASKTKKIELNLHDISIETIKEKVFYDLPGLEENAVSLTPRIDPSWIGSDLIIVLNDRKGQRYEWACIISPLYSASSLRGRGKSSFIKSIAAASAFCDGLSIVAADSDEILWLNNNIEFLSRKTKIFVCIHQSYIHQYGLQKIIICDRYPEMGAILGLSHNIPVFKS